MSRRLRSGKAVSGEAKFVDLVPFVSCIVRHCTLRDGEAVVCRLPDCTVMIERRRGLYVERVVTGDREWLVAPGQGSFRVVGRHDFRSEFATPIAARSGAMPHAGVDRGATAPVDPMVRAVLERSGKLRPRSEVVRARLLPAALIAVFICAIICAGLAFMPWMGATDVAGDQRADGHRTNLAPAELLGSVLERLALQEELARLDHHVGSPAIALLSAIAAETPPGVTIDRFDVSGAQLTLTLRVDQAVPVLHFSAILPNLTGIDLAIVAITRSPSGATALVTGRIGSVDAQPAHDPEFGLQNANWMTPSEHNIDELRREIRQRREEIAGSPGGVEQAASEITQVIGATLHVQYELETDVTDQTLRVRLDGPAEELALALPEIDQIATAPGRYLRSLNLQTFPGQDRVRLDISLSCFSGEISAPPLGQALSHQHVDAMRQTWPTASSDRLAHALGAESPLAALGTVPDSPESPALSSPSTGITTRRLIRYLGLVRVDSVDRFAVRLIDEDTVSLMRVGETAFGWTLSHASQTELGFVRAGEVYEVVRD